jgi:hypothetical protein
MKDVVVEKLMVVKDADTNRLFAVFTDEHDHLVVRGMGAGVEWAKWVTRRKLSPDELAATLDPGLVIDGPVAPTQQMLKLLAAPEQVKSAEAVAYHDWVNRTAANAILEKRDPKRRGFGEGLARGLQAGLNLAREMIDGDGDGNYARDADGVDDDPMPGKPGPLTRGLDMVQRGAEAVEDVARGAETRDTPREDRTPIDARVLGALGRAIRPGGLRAERERIGADVAERRARGAKRRAGVAGGYDPDGPGDGDGMKRRPSVVGMLRAIARKDRKAIGARSGDGWALPYKVEVGNKGLDTLEKAKEHVGNGGDLADVPDDFLSESILAHLGTGKRFEQLGVPSSINRPKVFRDTVSGQEMILKYATGRGASYDEHLTEMLGAHVAERFGFPAGTARWAGPMGPEQRGYPGMSARPIVISLASEMTDLDYDLSSVSSRRDEKTPLRENVRFNLLDFAIVNTDRHDQNFLITATDPDGVAHLYPIDHGHTFTPNRPADGSWSGFRQILGQLRSNKSKRQMRAALRDGSKRSEIVEEIKALQEDLRRAQQDMPIEDVVAQLVDGADLYDGPQGQAVDKLAERLQFLIDAGPEEIYDTLAQSL